MAAREWIVVSDGRALERDAPLVDEIEERKTSRFVSVGMGKGGPENGVRAVCRTGGLWRRINF